MYIVYLLQHTETLQCYIGRTKDLKRRIAEHNRGEQKATKRNSGKWVLIYAEAYRSEKDAVERENKLKQHGSNKRWLQERVKNSMLQN